MSPTLMFDCDGVLADTERYGHLPAFNETFADLGLPVTWSDGEYAELVKIGGGKERMAHLLTPDFLASTGLPAEAAEQSRMLEDWHQRKTAKYTARVVSGAIPGRPGIARIVEEAAAEGWLLSVVSTSAEASVRTVLEHVVGRERAAEFAVFAGDLVEKKKPAPDIYLLALRELGIAARDAIVVEDSANGLRAALAAGLTTMVTVSSYTAEDDFTGAALVVSSLGEAPSEKTRVIDDPHHLGLGDEVTLADLVHLLNHN